MMLPETWWVGWTCTHKGWIHLCTLLTALVPHPLTHEPCLRRLVLWFAVILLATAVCWCYIVADLLCFARLQSFLPGPLAPRALSYVKPFVVCRLISIGSRT